MVTLSVATAGEAAFTLLVVLAVWMLAMGGSALTDIVVWSFESITGRWTDGLLFFDEVTFLILFPSFGLLVKD
jgi:hypothetical protein